tara:strand:- start:25468 stop:26361 length:894 start_codon:yes stop_codon:yes gene_type:complete
MTLKAVQSEYYGDATRWFIGDVIDNTPPYGLEGRVRIRIHGVHSPSTIDIRQSDLPWAQVVIPTTEGGVSGLGSTPRLETSALVFGLFMDGAASQVPIVIGSLPRTEFPSRIQKQLEFETIEQRSSIAEEFYKEASDRVQLNLPLIEDDNYGVIPAIVKSNRAGQGVKFFMSGGYTLKQATAIIVSLEQSSNLESGVINSDGSLGIARFKGDRLRELKAFANDYKRYTMQLAFVLYELNTVRTNANIRLLQTDSVDINVVNNSQMVFAKYYLDIKSYETTLLNNINTGTATFYDEIV